MIWYDEKISKQIGMQLHSQEHKKENYLEFDENRGL
jgi:hypothetical protein